MDNITSDVITVDFVLPTNEDSHHITFAPNGGNVDVNSSEATITWQIGTAPYGAVITAIAMTPDAGAPPWSPADLPTAENNWTAMDVNAQGPCDPPVSWDYTVTITYRGVEYTSDPKITNDPPTGLTHHPPKA
jgi:hypothetical protein